jgi:hypothetical protein
MLFEIEFFFHHPAQSGNIKPLEAYISGNVPQDKRRQCYPKKPSAYGDHNPAPSLYDCINESSLIRKYYLVTDGRYSQYIK